jgi:hypothetical protein
MGYFCNFQAIGKSTLSNLGRKFAQSGHPDCLRTVSKRGVNVMIFTSFAPTAANYAEKMTIKNGFKVNCHFFAQVINIAENSDHTYVCNIGLGHRVARFILVQNTKTGKIYQITTKYTKWP